MMSKIYVWQNVSWKLKGVTAPYGPAALLRSSHESKKLIAHNIYYKAVPFVVWVCKQYFYVRSTVTVFIVSEFNLKNTLNFQRSSRKRKYNVLQKQVLNEHSPIKRLCWKLVENCCFICNLAEQILLFCEKVTDL